MENLYCPGCSSWFVGHHFQSLCPSCIEKSTSQSMEAVAAKESVVYHQLMDDLSAPRSAQVATLEALMRSSGPVMNLKPAG